MAKHKLEISVVVILVLGMLMHATSLADEEILKFALEPSFSMTERGLCYALYGKSVISQNKLELHSTFEIRDLPEKTSAIKAFLYWAGEVEAYKTADTKLELKDYEGNVSIIHADKVRSNVISGLVYVSRADVTEYIKGNGIYEISYIDADPLEPVEIAGKIKKKSYYTLGGWALAVVFKDPSINDKSNIKIYDGMIYMQSGEAKREGKYGLRRLGHDISKETLYSQTTVKIDNPGLPDARMVDFATITGFGRPWDGGSVTFDGSPISGREDYAGSAGFCWDITRDLIFLEKGQKQPEHEIEFITDYNSIMPLAIITRFGNLEKSEIMRLASSYITQSEMVNTLNFFDVRDSTFEQREFMAKNYIQEILRAKAIALFNTLKRLDVNIKHDLHLELGKLYLEQNRLDLAEMELAEAINQNTEDSRGYFNLSQVYYRKRDIDKAIFYLEQAKKRADNGYLICQNLGTCFLQKGLYEEAIEQFEEAIKLNPEVLTSYYCLYNIYEAKKQTAKKIYILKLIEDIKKKEKK